MSSIPRRSSGQIARSCYPGRFDSRRVERPGCCCPPSVKRRRSTPPPILAGPEPAEKMCWRLLCICQQAGVTIAPPGPDHQRDSYEFPPGMALPVCLEKMCLDSIFYEKQKRGITDGPGRTLMATDRYSKDCCLNQRNLAK